MTKQKVKIQEKETALELAQTGQALQPTKDPSQLLKDASKVAKELTRLVTQHRWATDIKGKKYLHFEAWQTLGSFYHLVPKVVETKYVEYGQVKGFEARAVVINTATGMEVGAGEGISLSDESKRRGDPLYVHKGMAQTRACSRAMRHILSHVAVLAGYEPTPKEEMSEVEDKVYGGNVVNASTPTSAPSSSDDKIKQAKLKWINALVDSGKLPAKDYESMGVQELNQVMDDYKRGIGK